MSKSMLQLTLVISQPNRKPDLVAKSERMKKILVPTDFSANAQRAIQYAVELARRSNSILYLMHTCDDLINPVAPGQDRITSEYNEKLIQQAQQDLNNLCLAIKETENLEVNSVLYFGFVRESVQKAVEEYEIDLVIMGTLGKSGLIEKLLGSKTANVMTHCKKPVISIPLEYDWSLPQKILASVNDFEEANQLLTPVFELAGLFAAQVQIGIFTDEDVTTATGFMQHARDLQHWQETWKKRYSDISFSTVHLSGHHFDESILQHIEHNNIDLLAMVTHPRSWIDAIFNRSKTRKMGYEAKIPILAIPATVQV